MRGWFRVALGPGNKPPNNSIYHFPTILATRAENQLKQVLINYPPEEDHNQARTGSVITLCSVLAL